MNYLTLLEPAVAVVRDAGRLIIDAWSAPRDVRRKGAIDLVTDTDFAVQARLKKDLLAIAPGSGFLGEEKDGVVVGEGDFRWIVDPVDGTTNFVHKIPMTAISVALAERDRPVLGVIFAPMLDECFYAAKGAGAFLNGRPIAVSRVARLSEAVVATGFPYDVKASLDSVLGRLARLLPEVQGTRSLGSAAIDLGYVASGRFDAFYEAGLKPWDMAAGWIIVEEAGGRATTVSGEPMDLRAPLLASNGLIHDETLALLKGD